MVGYGEMGVIETTDHSNTNRTVLIMTSPNKRPCAVFVSNLRVLGDMRIAFSNAEQPQVIQDRETTGFRFLPEFCLNDHVRGFFVVLLRSPQEMVSQPKQSVRIINNIVEASVERFGADVVGLGSLTASVTVGGKLVADYVNKRGLPVAITHGDSGSVAATLECLAMTRPNASQTIAVVGAYGVIGSALSRVLCAENREVIVCGRSPDKLARLASSISENGGRAPIISVGMSLLKEADYVITVTSSSECLLTPDMVKPRAVIIDPAVPANVADHPDWRSQGNIVISNASQVRLKGLSGMMSERLGLRNESDGCPVGYACFAETLINAAARDGLNHVGEIDLSFVDAVKDRFRRYGIDHVTPRMFSADVGLAT